MRFIVTVDDSEIKRLERLSDLNLKDALEDVGEYLLQRIALCFRFERDPKGNRWPDLRKTTKKNRRGESYHILRDSGRLKDSFTKEVSKNRVMVGTSVKYAKTHQFGAKKGQFGTVEAKVREHIRNYKGREVKVREHTRKITIPWGDIPPRPFMGITEKDKKEIMDIILNSIRRRIIG
ncbi:phage virion morphogenesis (putative tail completion) protein [Desulfonauticus submarinus]|uniref:Phage virion morphogenesis (Putative tail completion) protein n=1 Tax=Desulfonauticus submarinus TaxID=206665 RepID=A0A1H0GB82_9BACT|nr:phage virion morphogenesis protein [Desulfonauticus submarinus]SDO04142.1 phage virion morphogenesis (putative tail completion) protein [Desulfonauticus submarinus]